MEHCQIKWGNVVCNVGMIWNMVNGSIQNQDGNKVPIGSAGPEKVYSGALWQKRNSQLLHLERVEKSKVARVPKARSRECI